MINFIVCDNEKIINENVKNIITKAMFKTNIEYKTYLFEEYNKDFDNIIKSKIQNKIYILDIEVGKKSGLDIAKKIREKDWDSIILILSAHYEMEFIAYKSKILLLDFISKFDIYDKKMYEIITTCVNKKISNEYFTINAERKHKNIYFNDILYITYDSFIRKTKIITYNEIYETIAPLKHIKDKLKGNFVYSHRSCIINLNNVKSIDYKNKIITFKNNTNIDLLSRNYIKEVREYANS